MFYKQPELYPFMYSDGALLLYDKVGAGGRVPFLQCADAPGASLHSGCK
jgi:hypothetical protein